MEWYYIKEGAQFGPVDKEELGRLAREGPLSREDLVWNASLGDQWAAASSIEGLFAEPSPPPALEAEGNEGEGTPNRDLMASARESLKGHWGRSIAATLLYLAPILVIVFAMATIQGVATYRAGMRAQHARQMAAAHVSTTTVTTTAAPHQGPGVTAGRTLPPKIVLSKKVRVVVHALQFIQFLISGALMLGVISFFLNIARGLEARPTMVYAGFRCFGRALCAYFLMMLFILLWTLLLVIPGIIAAYSYSMTFFILADDPSATPMEALKRSKEMMRGKRWKLFCLMCRFIGWYLLSLLTCNIGLLWVFPYFQTSCAHFYDDVRPKQ